MLANELIVYPKRNSKILKKIKSKHSRSKWKYAQIVFLMPIFLCFLWILFSLIEIEENERKAIESVKEGERQKASQEIEKFKQLHGSLVEKITSSKSDASTFKNEMEQKAIFDSKSQS
jgi:uncharacterized protein YpmS